MRNTAKQASSADHIESICSALAAEPVFHLSLHSRELFHSNLLGWLFEKYPAVGHDVLSGTVGKDRSATETRVHRERNNLDLIVALPGLRTAVIENKVFDLPRESQLAEYAEKPEASGKELVLLSLHNPGWPRGRHRGWRYLGYGDLLARLRGASSDLKGFDRKLVDHYCSLLASLTELVAACGVTSMHDHLEVPAETQEILRRHRLHATVAKMRAQTAAQLLGRSLERSAPVQTGFTRGRPFLEQFARLDSGDELGWQFQAGQWRLVVRTATHRRMNRRARERHVRANYPTWFDFTPTESICRVPAGPAPTRAAFNGYEPNFVYRYQTVGNLTIAEIRKLAGHYIASVSEQAGPQ